MGFVIGGAIAGVGALGGAAISASGAQAAAKEQAAAAEQAAQVEQTQQQQVQSNLQPYNLTGQALLPTLGNYYQTTAGNLSTAYNQAQAQLPTSMTQAQLVQTPGYQFNLSAGLAATQNSQAAKGLGISGAAIKQADSFATGLANSTYSQQLQNQTTIYGAANQQFQNALNQSNAVYSQLAGPAQLGENAGAQAGFQGTLGAANVGNSLEAAGTAEAAGTSTAANAYGGALNSLGSTLGGLQLYQALQQANGVNALNPNSGAESTAVNSMYANYGDSNS